MRDLISRQAAIDAIHGAIFDFFDICDDDEESPMIYKDEQLLEINKAISGRIKRLPSAKPEIIRCKDCKHNPKETWLECSMSHLSEKQRPETAWCWKGERRQDDIQTADM